MLTADDLTTAIRVHADRVHDAVRRLGCPPEAAAQVVLTSALELVEAVRRDPDGFGDPVGWWFARARVLGRSTVAGPDDPLPVGGGVLSSDASQVRLAQALEERPEAERAALLLRDSYDLPAASVGAALGLDADQAMEYIGGARLAFLPTLLGGTQPPVPDHVPLAALSRLAEGGQIAARDATARRHVQSCDGCAAVVDAQERARRLLSSLTVVALPEADREVLMGQVSSRVGALPQVVEQEVEEDDEPGRRWTAALVLLGFVVAVGLGVGFGAYSSRDRGGNGLGTTSVALVTAAPALTAQPRPVPSISVPSPSPTPRVFVITPPPPPSPTPSPTLAPSPGTSGDVLGIALDPTSGPNDTDVVVTGQGFEPGSTVSLTYRDMNGTVGSTGSALVDARGRFTGDLAAHDDTGLPGDHTVHAEDGAATADATFTAG